MLLRLHWLSPCVSQAQLKRVAVTDPVGLLAEVTALTVHVDRRAEATVHMDPMGPTVLGAPEALVVLMDPMVPAVHTARADRAVDHTVLMARAAPAAA